MNHRLSTTKLIMDFVDVDSDKWAQYARYASFPKSWIYRLESSRLSRYERKVGEAFNHSLFVTQAEVEVFRNANPHIRNVTAISNGVDVDYFSPAYSSPASGSRHPASSGDRRPKIVFTGAMDYHANVDSVCWFSNEIFPRIRQELPETEFYIVGSNPTSEVKALSNNNGIIVTGFVPDMREYLKRATVAVAPLRIARGIQNKVLEAMAMGLPVVATPQAFEGIDAAPADDLLVEDGAEAFSKALTQVLRTPSLRTYLGINARKCIESNYSWSKHFSKLDELIE